jgi:hypothetical protein
VFKPKSQVNVVSISQLTLLFGFFNNSNATGANSTKNEVKYAEQKVNEPVRRATALTQKYSESCITFISLKFDGEINKPHYEIYDDVLSNETVAALKTFI